MQEMTLTFVPKALVIFLSLLLSACATTSTPPLEQNRGLTFIHMNDTYRVADVEDGTRGGFGRVVTTIRELQAAGREVHVLHGGDLLSPSLESQVWFGGQMVRALNFVDDLAPVHLVAGNHEFDFREQDLAYFINAVRSSRFDWIGDNYRFTSGDEVADAAVQSNFIFEAAGKRIGVIRSYSPSLCTRTRAVRRVTTLTMITRITSLSRGE